MIVLDAENKAIEELLATRLEKVESREKLEKVSYSIADFDDCMYAIYSPKESRNELVVNIKLHFWRDLLEHGVVDALKVIYGEHFRAKPDEGYSATLHYDLEKVVAMSEEERKRVVSNAGLFRRHCFAAVFTKYFEFQQKLAVEAEKARKAGQVFKPTNPLKHAVLNYRSDETMYVAAQADRVTVVFSTVFKDPDDMIIGKVFMQEFKEGRRKYSTAPQVLFTDKEPPAELNNLQGCRKGENVGYITFILFARHTMPSTRDNTINIIYMLRNYLHYHIKCSKSYLNQRMRCKTNDFLKILNNARQETKPREKKTFQGTRFENSPSSGKPKPPVPSSKPII